MRGEGELHVGSGSVERLHAIHWLQREYIPHEHIRCRDKATHYTCTCTRGGSTHVHVSVL